ncbi:hypothetical protein WHR41_02147 [Cladosporium halotolerans]|uniref:Protein HRI1 n=1 Tax=Cladosporium halotolerans TaxID=1052096 RepID=A0AB34KVP2_9PEZI
MPPSISTRAFIQFPPFPPSEPTHTTVLTSTQHHFVDIRVLKTAPTSQISPSDLDWAFAGVSSRSGAHAQWQHWVDSRTREAESVVDKGEMVEGGEEGVELEKGVMVNPATGLEGEYVEGWREVEAEVTGKVGEGAVEGVLEGLRRDGVWVEGLGKGGEGRVSVVLKHENAEVGSRGMIVRVGQRCQGVARVGDEFGLESWEWSGDSGWQRKYVMGTMSIPCEVLNMLGDLVGKETKVGYGGKGDSIWRAVEAERF